MPDGGVAAGAAAGDLEGGTEGAVDIAGEIFGADAGGEDVGAAAGDLAGGATELVGGVAVLVGGGDDLADEGDGEGALSADCAGHERFNTRSARIASSAPNPRILGTREMKAERQDERGSTKTSESPCLFQWFLSPCERENERV